MCLFGCDGGPAHISGTKKKEKKKRKRKEKKRK